MTRVNDAAFTMK